MSTVRETASLRFSTTLDGTKSGKPRRPSSRRVLAKTTHTVVVDVRVMRAARAVQRPGEKLFIVSATEVILRAE